MRTQQKSKNLLPFVAVFFALTGLLLPACPAKAAEGTECKISCIDPHPGCAESEKIIEELKQMADALSSGDIEKVSAFFDEQCTTFDKHTKKLISGKEAVIKDIKARLILHNPNSQEPLKAFTIDQPYAFVHGDTATVNFVAYKEYGGEHPYKMKSQCTDIFVKRGDTWKKLHYSCDWKRVK